MLGAVLKKLVFDWQWTLCTLRTGRSSPSQITHGLQFLKVIRIWLLSHNKPRIGYLLSTRLRANLIIPGSYLLILLWIKRLKVNIVMKPGIDSGLIFPGTFGFLLLLFRFLRRVVSTRPTRWICSDNWCVKFHLWRNLQILIHVLLKLIIHSENCFFPTEFGNRPLDNLRLRIDLIFIQSRQVNVVGFDRTEQWLFTWSFWILSEYLRWSKFFIHNINKL